MAVDDLNKLFKHELGDLLYAEKTFLKGLKVMAKETSDPMMKDRILQHADETEGQIDTIERAFEAAGFKVKAEKCDGALGLKAEHDSFKEDEPEAEVLEAFNLGSGLRVEHYEIAGYRSAIALARALGFEESASLLQQNLSQEEEMARFLESNAPAALAKLGAAQEGIEVEVEVEPEVSRSRGSGGTKFKARSGSSRRGTSQRAEA